MAPTAAILVGFALFAVATMQLVRELNSVSGGSVVWWHLLVPLYGLYLGVTLIPAEMAKAKQTRGKGPPRSLLAYLFLFLYAFASDINDLAS